MSSDAPISIAMASPAGGAAGHAEVLHLRDGGCEVERLVQSAMQIRCAQCKQGQRLVSWEISCA